MELAESPCVMKQGLWKKVEENGTRWEISLLKVAEK